MKTITEILGTTLFLGVGFALFSGMIQGFAGFGGALLMVTLLAVLFNPVEAVAITAIASTVGQVTLIPAAVRQAHWPEVAPVSVATAIAIPVGLMFLVSADPHLIRRGMGVFILVAVGFLISGWTYGGKRTLFTSAATGVLAGGIFGGFGIPGGPFMVVYYLSAPVPPPVKRANIIVTAMIGMTFMFIGLIAEGVYTKETLIRALIIAPAFLAGTWAGKGLFKIAPADWFKYVAYAVLIATGIVALTV